MPILAYIAVILVSLGGILFEVNWLTSPKLESKPALQASATMPPKVAVAADTDASPRNVAPSVTMVPGVAAAPKPVEAPSAPPQQTASAPTITPEPVATPITPAPTGAATVAETTGTGSTDFKREFTTDTKADVTTSTATFTPAVTTPVAAVAAPAVASVPNNKCDVAACASSYQSFRASDCSYQPMDGTARKTCDRPQAGAQQASMPVREKKIETTARRDVSSVSKLRSFEREVRRITADEAPSDSYRYGRSQVIVIDNRD